MRCADDTPGLKVRRNRDGTERVYWVARPDLVAKGYRPKTVRLHYNAADPSDRMLIAAACMKLQAEMLDWSAGRRDVRCLFDGTIASLIRLY
ncbi:MAG: hypothetical protein U1E81_18315 [Xanthobacteraceae bacterium]